MKPPDNGGGDAAGSEEVFDIAVEADRDAAEVLDPAEGSFNDIALFIERPVVFILDFPVLPGWDNRLCTSLHEPFPQGRTVVSLVSNQFF